MTLDSRTRWLALLIVCLGDLMIVLDVTIVGVALPSIREDLGFSETSLAWVVNAYLLTFGGFLLLGGRLGDLFGHRRLFIAGIALFTAASLACGLAGSQAALIGARAVQGVGGAVVSAVALSLIVTLFTEPAERAKAMGVFGFVAAGGGSIGVLLGGIITDALAWNWIFLVNVPIGIAVVAFSLMVLPGGSGVGSRVRLDVAGAITVTASLMVAVYAIVNGNEVGWATTQTLGLLAVAGALLGAVPLHRVARRGAARAARALPAAQPRRLERRRRALGRGDVRVVLPLRALSPARARLQPARGRSRVPPREPHHGRVLARPLGEARDALRDPRAARCRSRPRRSRVAAVRPRAGRRILDRRAPEHGSARHRRGDGVQSAAARRDGRRPAGGGRPRVWRRQHRLHDGRRARPRRPRESRCLTYGDADGRRGAASSPRWRAGYHAAFLVGAIFAASAAAIGALMLRPAGATAMQTEHADASLADPA